MGNKVNFKARIERHSRILLQQGRLSYRKNNRRGKGGYRFVSFLLVFLIPIYPVFASFVTDASVYDFDRSEIDESSILSSSVYEKPEGGNLYIDAEDSYFYINASLDNTNQTSTSNKILVHTVIKDESIESIANDYNISSDTIVWENDLDRSAGLKIGQELRILPVSGLTHKVRSGETIEGIADEYGVKKEILMRQNMLLEANDLKAGSTIVIPGAIKPEPVPEPVVQKNKSSSTNTRIKTKDQSKPSTPAPAANKKPAAQAQEPQAEQTNVQTEGYYQLKWRQPQHTFYWGNCTWYVGQYKNVNWGGNANQWLRNARAKGHPTGNTPSVGAIITFNGHGYNPRYGHVGIVMQVKSDTLIISDMNYRALGEVTTREISKYDPAITGYIYVD